MSTVTCELCDTEQVVEPCEDYRCLNCGQLYVKQYYKQALGRLNLRFRGRSDELTDEQILNMTKEEAVNLITNSVYAATELMERLEASGKLRGNGHHARQAVSLKAEEEINTRWRGLGD